jgi:serine/threonine protein kinase
MTSRYRIVAPHASASDADGGGDLGQGAYGVVYKALDTQTNTMVALKKMKVETQVDGVSSSTLREITFLRQLKHENVVVLRDVQMQQGRISLIFELEECDLSKLLASSPEPFSEDTVRVSLFQIVCAVSSIFRDLLFYRTSSVIHSCRCSEPK